MPLLHRLCALMSLLFHRNRVEEDLDSEVNAFYQTMADRYVAQGLSEQEARRKARLQFQHAEQVKERVRDARAGAGIASFLADVRFAFRAIYKAPAFALVTIITLGLGIGANSTIFSIVSRFVLKPPPVRDPVALLAVHTTHQGNQCCNRFSWPLFSDVRDQAKSFSGVASYHELVPASMTGSGDPERVWGQAATANFFDVTQLPLTLGRGFTKDEEDQPVVVIGYSLWQRRFGADPAIASKSVRLSGRPFTIVGVAPKGFRGLDLILNCEFWVPLGNLDQLLPNTSDRISRDHHWINVIGRLRPGISVTQAAAELNVLAQNFAKAYPNTDKGGGFHLTTAGSLPPRGRASVEMFFAALTIVALLVLCIACANVANLALAKTSGRQREMAVRLALGATRGHLLRQMLCESVLLAFGGGLCGVALSLWATHGLESFHLPAPVPLDLSVAVDWRVLLYTFAVSAGAGVLFGLAPAWTAARPVISSALKGEDVLARPGRIWSLRNVLVISQIAMSLVLLCSTGLCLRSLENASRIDVGFRTRNVLMMAVDPRLHGYTPARTTQFLDLLRHKVGAIPGVISAACTDSIPLSGGFRSDSFEVEGHPNPSTRDSNTELYMVTPGYFDTIGIQRVAGREFTQENANGPRGAVVNEAFVRMLFKNVSPIGQRVSGGARNYQIIGVVKDIQSRTIGEHVRPVLFRALAQDIGSDPSISGYSVLVHYSGNSGEIAKAVRQEIQALDPSLAIFNFSTMEEHLRDAFFLPRLAGTLFGIFGFIGLTLASVGLYSVMSYWVSQRTREIGIRIALGAQIARVQQLFIRQGMLLLLIAVVPGIAAALALSKLFTSVLYGIPPHDLITFTFVPLFLTAIAFLACWIPSRRAAGIEPLAALRHE